MPTMKSKTKTAAGGMVAACAASSSSSAPSVVTATPLSSSSTAAATASHGLECYKSSLSRTPSLLGRIPRGGHSPSTASSSTEESTTESTTAATREGEKKRKKKKKTKSKGPKSASSSSSQTSQSKQNKEHEPTSSDDADDQSQSQTASSTDDKSSTTSTSSSSSSPLPPAAASILTQTCHYDVLGITKTASQIEIQKAYRRRCVLTHPDKIPGGDRSAFDKVSEAYDVLGCEKKRAVYDRFGREGLENGLDGMASGMGGGMGGMRGFGFGTGSSNGSFFGNDVFRDFFGAGVDPFFGRRTTSGQQSSTQSPFRRAPPRNRDLRYQLEVTLEELYKGTTKHVAIQQPNPLRPHFPYRKEVEVTLAPGMHSGQSVRLSGVVDSVPDAAPADVIFLIRERRHAIFTRRGNDLAMEIKIGYGEAIVGFKRKVRGLDGKEICIGSPFVRRVEKREEVVDVPALPMEEEGECEGDAVDGVTLDAEIVSGNNTTTNATAAEDDRQEQSKQTETTTPDKPEQIIKTTTISYNLPPTIIQTGDVHVLKGHGMPKKQPGSSHAHHNHDQQYYGDLYIQYVVEMPGSQDSAGKAKTVNVDNLSPEERVELARLLSKLEGSKDVTKSVVCMSSCSDGDEDMASLDAETNNGENCEKVHHLALASASDFGQSCEEEHNVHDEHLHHHDDDEHHHHHHNGGMPHGFHSEDIGDFFQRAFTGRSSSQGGFGGMGGGGSGSGFHYFSSAGGGGSGFGYGGHRSGEEEDHKVECNQM